MAGIGGLMSLLEGHGDITMTRAAGPLVPNAERFERILRERRRTTNPLSRTVMRLTGMEAKLNQYAAGARFIGAIEADRGERAVDLCWTSPDHLPTLEEVRAPATWLTRTEHLVG
jgi:putative hydrolase